MIDCRRIGLFISPPHSVFFIFCGHWLRVKASRIKIFKLFICPHYMISAECTSSLNACLIVDFFDKQQKSSLVVLSAPPRLTESLPLTREEVSRRNCVFVCKTYKNILVITHNTHTLIQKSYSHSSERQWYLMKSKKSLQNLQRQQTDGKRYLNLLFAKAGSTVSRLPRTPEKSKQLCLRETTKADCCSHS